MMKLREYIRLVLLETYIGGGSRTTYLVNPVMRFMDSDSEGESSEEELLIEPDYPNDDQEESEVEQEASAGGVAGVSVPLGAGPTYPKKNRKKRKGSA